jgi:hypothetical protein
VKLRSETGLQEDPKRIIAIRHLWLATERNYLPVKTEAFDTDWSKTLPGEVGHMSDFREIAPGIWLPFQRTTITYTDYKLGKNKVVVNNIRETTLTKVDLNPRYDISLFRDIPIPDGTRVYEVKDDRIINEYNQGERTSPHWQPRRPWWRWLVAPFVGLLLITSWATYRWLARKRAQTPATTN